MNELRKLRGWDYVWLTALVMVFTPVLVIACICAAIGESLRR